MGGSVRRIGAVARAEALLMLRDPSSFGIAVVLPTVLLLLFGYGVNLDPRHVPVAWFDPIRSPDSRRLTSSFDASGAFSLREVSSARDGLEEIRHRRARALLRLLDDAPARALAGREASLQLLLDGIDANTARIVEGFTRATTDLFLAQEARLRRIPAVPHVAATARIWFNQTANSRRFLVPGLVAILMTILGALLTSMVAARDWDRGTIESLLSSPLSRTEMIVGKLLPAFALGMAGLALTVGCAVFLFHVPLRGSPWLLFAASALYLTAMLGQGLLISTVARSRFVAGQIAIVTAFLPAFMLSGFLFDIDSMPGPIRAVTYVVPARWFVPITRTLFLVGDERSVLATHLPVVAFFALLFLALAVHRTPRRIDL